MPLFRLVDWIFATIVILTVAARFIVLGSGGAPATIDAGNWLAFGKSIFGAGIRSPTIVYPPLVPILTKGFVDWLGMIRGIAALGAISSAAPAVGFYIALRRFGSSWEVLPGALILLGASAIGETTAWGGFPQLIGLGLAPLLLFELDRWMSNGNRGSAIRSGLLLMLLLATSHFIALTAIVAGVLLLAFRLPSLRRRKRPRSDWIIDTLLLVLPSIWLIPLYLTLIGAFFGSSGDFRFLNQLTWSNALSRIEFLYRDFPQLWRVILPLAIATPAVFLKRRSSTLWRVLTAILISAGGLALISREGRFLYFLTLAVALAVTLWLRAAIDAVAPETPPRKEPRSWRRHVLSVALAGLLGLALWQVLLGLSIFGEQRDYYGVLTPGLFKSLEAVRDETPADTVLAVASIRDAPLGWWVEAITNRETFYASALRWLSYDDELRRARIGNQIFTRTFPDTESLQVAEENGIDYLIIPTRWAFYDVDNLGSLPTAASPAFFSARDILVVQMNYELGR